MLFIAVVGLAAQEEPAVQGCPAPAGGAESSASSDKRAYGVLPNYRSAELGNPFVPISNRRKMYIGYKDSTDYPVYFLSGAFAALYQLEDSHPSFGQGMKGFGKRYVTGYADQTIGNMMTESLLPVLFHEDPRYFRKGTGSVGSRLGYAATRIFVVRADSGKWRFNASEVIGNGIAAGIGNAYYPDERSVNDNIQRFYTALGTDAISQILKEFWPDVKRKWFKRK